MELELKKACFDAYEAAGELTLTQEETAETIVPDYCPDIARIIETTGKVFLHSREMRDGRAEISGTVRVTVLDTPEVEWGIRTLEFAMPFTVETDGRSLPDCAALLADTEPELLETRMLNPRKVFTHCKLVTRLTGYQRRPLCFCTDAEAGPELCIEKKQEQQHAIVLTHIAEKDFTFSEQMDLSPGREGAAEILTSRVNSTVTETKIVGSKLLFKGIFTVSLLYRTADGHCCAASGELPFSQILEVEGAPEGAEPSVRLQFTGADLQVDGADAEGREIAVTLYLHATALLRQTQELPRLWNSPAFGNSSPAVRRCGRCWRSVWWRIPSWPSPSPAELFPSAGRGRAWSCGPGRLSGHCIWTRGACLWWRSGASTSAANWSCRRTAGSLPGPSARKRSRAA